MKNKKKEGTGMRLELIGGIYLVEEFANGSEKRNEIDGELVLKMLIQVVKARCLSRSTEAISERPPR